jgi:periplasmic protein CpxP/Spy
MQRVASPFTSSIVLAMAVVVLLVTSALTSARPSRLDTVEERIRELHAQLQITPAQEDLWINVAQVMRDNARTMDAHTQAQAAKAQTMTALDALETYTDIVEAHAEGLKKFTPAFEALYNSMSDAQKQQADTVFRNHSHMRAARHEAPGP